MATAVVTGCNGGIGHAFACILCSEGYELYGLDVNVGANLESLKQEGAHVAHVDVTSQISNDSFRRSIGDRIIDSLLNIAGTAKRIEYRGRILTDKYRDDVSIRPGFSINKSSILNETISVNTIGPSSLMQALLPNLLKSSSPRIGNMFSRVGSVGDNTSGGLYVYRASKAALNSVSRRIAMDLKREGVVVVIMHPEYEKTGLSPWDHNLPEAVEPEEAAPKMWRVLMSRSVEDTGKF